MIVTREGREVLERNLRARYSEGAVFTRETITQLAPYLGGLSERQIRRRIAAPEGSPARRPAWRPTDQVFDVLHATKGNAVAAHAVCVDKAIDVPKLRAFQYGISRHAPTWNVETARRSHDGHLATGVVVKRVNIDARNSVWSLDHTVLPIALRPQTPRGEVWCPWATTMLDDYTNLYLFGFLSENQPDSDDSMACLALAVEGTTMPDGTWFGGVPKTVLTDRGADLMTIAANLGLAGEGINRRLTEVRTPRQNGGVERAQGVQQTKYLSRLPGFLPGKIGS